MKPIKIITRNSQLAMWQALFVEAKLKENYPSINTEIIGIVTKGDKILDRSLDKVGGKGLFIKELENSLITKEVDFAVHSLKDLPANLVKDFSIAAVLKRENPHDAFVSNKYNSLEELPDNAIVGTSSIRRVSILKHYYPKCQIKLLRGNLNTRLKKLDDGEYDAIILACAGLIRLGMKDRIKQQLDKTKFVPSIGQGAIALEVLTTNHEATQMLQVLSDKETSICTSLEREVGQALNASCSVPLAVHSEVVNGSIKLHAVVYDVENNTQAVMIIEDTYNDQFDYKVLARKCVDGLVTNGALEILKKYN